MEKTKQDQYEQKIKTLQALLTKSNKDLSAYQKANLELQKEIEDAAEEVLKIRRELRETYTNYYNAVRAYQGLCHYDKAAKDLGIDTRPWILPETDKKYDFKLKSTVNESGKVSHIIEGKPIKKGEKANEESK